MTIKLDLQLAVKNNNGLPSKRTIYLWLTALIIKPYSEITIRIVDSKEIQNLNYQYRGKKTLTNVLSFPFVAPLNIKSNLLGDVVICRQVVEQEAIQQNKPLMAHWAHMIIHGSLHLLGYNHIKDNEAKKMEFLETTIIKKIGFADPYL
ncbi:putative rRNA maturation factor [Candidatus Photodesmus katoptron]|uniref:rRNA maturation RNase YbeY n=1 Tax=Candidatus Photodesmus anomalopis TaxID=28176 RepID=UPI0004D946A2|nr:rRNA maturation RNase YbeY [Candidatus Photodesmus katoptron]KEY90793.1 putative rRNA maturation factor [Candidatus Photodesmus katoptron]